MSKLNNGTLRGILYLGGSLALALGEKLLSWGDTPPKNGYIVSGSVLLAFGGMFNTWRAYIDQHLSRNPAP